LENLLKNEKSPYLKQHENNPVHWYPWSKKALAKAKELKKYPLSGSLFRVKTNMKGKKTTSLKIPNSVF